MVGSSSVRITLNRLSGMRIESGVNPNSVSFDVDVKMDEQYRTNNELTLNFLLTLTTKPSLVQYDAGGIVVVTGGKNVFDEALETDEKADVPKVLLRIYHKVFESIFLIASTIDAPYPPPDLLHSPYTERVMGSQAEFEADQQLA